MSGPDVPQLAPVRHGVQPGIQPGAQPGAQPVTPPVVLAGGEVDRRRLELTSQLGRLRTEAGLSVRAVADQAGVSTGTLWRIETGRADPRWSTFAMLAGRYGHLVDVLHPDRPRPPGLDYEVAAQTEGYWPCSRRVPMVLHADSRWWTNAQIVRIGAELWWARRHELNPPLDATGAAALLGINRSTLRNVEHGAFQPRLSTVIAAAGLTGRHLVFVAAR
ncbi:helix-turn-helix domain-containing protein [Nocardioides sp.]|uniref:helix-turn-helix domain-containing protein n=1 Tax=Nocardioides sp. TaxID=35761 RepID=UPI0037843899